MSVFSTLDSSRKQQDEVKRPQLDRNFDGIRALLFTKENIDASFGIWSTHAFCCNIPIASFIVMHALGSDHPCARPATL